MFHKNVMSCLLKKMPSNGLFAYPGSEVLYPTLFYSFKIFHTLNWLDFIPIPYGSCVVRVMNYIKLGKTLNYLVYFS